MTGVFWLAWLVPAAIVSATVASWLVGWASSRGVVDRPNDRSSHTKVTPRGGGIAIVGVTTLAAIIAATVWPESRAAMAALIVPALAIAYVSWLDDIKPLKNRVRFGVHLLSAVAVVAVVGPIQIVDMGGMGVLDLGVMAWPLTLIWVVGMTNAFNFMDGIDGIAGITAASAGASIAIATVCLGLPAIAGVAFAFAAAAIGFLMCNWAPAKIFMGDVGSAFCGFVIATLPIIAGVGPKSRLVTVAVFAMWPFTFDTIFTLIRRVLKRENVFEAHRSHLYQRLVIAGWSHRAVASLYGFLSSMAGSIAVAPFYDDTATPVITKVAAAFLVITALALLFLVQRAEIASAANSLSQRL